MTEIILQWTPEHGPRRKLTIKQTDDSWIRIETVWDGHEWRETGYERIENPTVHAPTTEDTDPTPPTIETLCNRIRHTWQTPDPTVLWFDTDNPIVIAAKDTSLRYYSARSTSWHPIQKTGLQHLIRQHGLPTVTTLTETPYSRAQLERGVTNDQ